MRLSRPQHIQKHPQRPLIQPRAQKPSRKPWEKARPMQVMDFEPDIATWGIPAKHGYPQNRELETELLMKDKSAEFSDTVEFDREADVFCRREGRTW